MMICGTGWQDWGQFQDRLGEWQGVWVDLTGAHLGPLPPSPPASTHLWAWSRDRWCRARMDEGEVIAGFLHEAGDCPWNGVDCRPAVTLPVLMAQSWTEQHVNAEGMRQLRWDVTEAVEGVAVSFVRLSGAVSPE